MALESGPSFPWEVEVFFEAGETETHLLGTVDGGGGVIVAVPGRRHLDGAPVVMGQRIDRSGSPMWATTAPTEGKAVFDSSELLGLEIELLENPRWNSMARSGLGIHLILEGLTSDAPGADRCIVRSSVSMTDGTGVTSSTPVVPCGPNIHWPGLVVGSPDHLPFVVVGYWEWSGSTTPPFTAHYLLPDEPVVPEITIDPAVLPRGAADRGDQVIARWLYGTLDSGFGLRLLRFDRDLAPSEGWPGEGLTIAESGRTTTIGPSPEDTPLPFVSPTGDVLQVWGEEDVSTSERHVWLRRITLE